MKRLIIAIDGPAAAGKSTAGKALATRLGYTYLDTGALYRAVAWLAEREGLVDSPGPVLGTMVRNADIRLEGNPRQPRVLVEGRDVSFEIRTEQFSRLSSKLSAVPEVRGGLLALQRRLGEGGGVVMDGRDIGTVIFPDADVKFFVSASLVARARRRFAELKAKDIDADPGQVLVEIEERDRRDSGREHAPLKAADDAVSVDTTDLDPEAVVAKMLAVVLSRMS